ncbi:MAG: hypothetical protein KDC35_02970 [Acidobacteria bacterium]|nr:hypothetical protein [Acidobacteriota bacterium]
MRFALCGLVVLSGLASWCQSRTWEDMGQVTTTLTVADVTWGRDRFVAVGFGADPIYSLDGENWMTGTQPLYPALSSVFFDGNWFFSMGAGAIFRSGDGVDFHWVHSESGWYRAMTCNKTRLVVVGDLGLIKYSDDEGITWNTATSPTSVDLRAVIYWGGQFIAAGEDRTIIKSSNGTSWSMSHQEPGTSDIVDLVPLGNEIPAFENAGAGVLSTNNFVTWTERTTYGLPNSTAFASHTGSQLIQLSGSSARYSSDGYHWADLGNASPFSTGQATCFATDGSTWVVLGSGGDVHVSRPFKAHHWQSLSSGENLTYVDLVRCEKNWVAVGYYGLISATEDGFQWRHQFVSGTTSLNGVARDGDELIAVGNGGKIYRSTDAGNTWNSVSSPTSYNLHDVATNGIRWVAVGDNGRVITSSNGTSWSIETSGTSEHLHAVTDNSLAQFWAAGDNGTVIVRAGGGTWSTNNIPVSMDLYGIARNPVLGFTFVVGENGTCYYNNAGWFSISLATTSHLRSVCMYPSNNGFAAVGDNGVIIEASNINFPAVTSGFGSASLNSVARHENGLMAIGNSGIAGCTLPRELGVATKIYTGPEDSLFKKIIHENDMYMALSFKNGLAWSTDGVTWSYIDVFPGSLTYNDLIWDGSQYVAVADGAISTSNDGFSWVTTNHSLGVSLTSIAYNGSTYVLGTFSGRVAYGNDLASLSVVTPPTQTANYVVWDGTRFHGFGLLTSAVIHSTNGATWTSSPITGGDQPVNMAFSGDLWVMTGSSVTWYSSNGTSWAQAPNQNVGGPLVWTGSMFVSTQGSDLVQSRDGVHWVPCQVGMNGNNFFWDQNSLLMTRKINAFDGELWRVPLSVDYNWGTTRMASFNTALFGLAFNGCRFVAVGTNGQILWSDDSVNWCVADSGTNVAFYDIAWIGDRFLAVGASGQVCSSPDGLTWTPESLGASTFLYAVYGNVDAVYAGGNDGLVYRSVDKGVSWTQVHDFFDDVEAFAYRAGRIVAVGKTGLIGSTTNGTSWTAHSSPTTSFFTDVAATQDGFLAVGLGGLVAYSSNGTTWQLLPSFTALNLTSVAVVGDRWIVASDNGIWTKEGTGDWAFHYVMNTGGLKDLIHARCQILGVGSNSRVWYSTWGTSQVTPSIESQDMDQEVCDGADLTIRVQGRGSNLKYAWEKDGVVIPGVSPVLNIFDFEPADEGTYMCHVWNAQGSIVSEPINLTLGTGFSGGLTKRVNIQGLLQIQLEAQVDCEVNPLFIQWEDLLTMSVINTGSNPYGLANPYPHTTWIEVTVQDTTTLESFTDQTLVLVSDNPLYFDANNDGCNTLQDIHFVSPQWGQSIPDDPNSDGVFNILDFIYINTSNDCL